MGRWIKGQVVASTTRDDQGEELSREAIQTLFGQVPEPWICFREHDTSQEPMCCGYNKRLAEMPDGGLALIIDIEVLDEEAFSRYGGFSIAFTNRTI